MTQFLTRCVIICIALPVLFLVQDVPNSRAETLAKTIHVATQGADSATCGPQSYLCAILEFAVGKAAKGYIDHLG